MYSFNDIIIDFDIFDERTVVELRERVHVLSVQSKYELILVDKSGLHAVVDHVKYLEDDDTDTLEVHAVEMSCPGTWFIGMNEEMFELYRIDKVKM